MKSNYRQTMLIRFFFGLGFLEGVVAFWNILSIPGSEKNVFLWGYSLSRLILLFLAAVPTFLFLIGLFVFAQADRIRKIQSWVNDIVTNKDALLKAFLFSGFLFLLSYFFVFIPDHFLGASIYLHQRLAPFAGWICILAAQSIAVCVLWRDKNDFLPAEMKDILRSAIWPALLFLVVIILISVSRWGLTPKQGYWQGLGTPILFQQVLFAIAIAIAINWLGEKMGAHDGKKKDLAISLLLWGLAFLFWNLQPLRPTYFAPAPVAPNFEYYPYADAELYDSAAQNLLIGNQLPTETIKNKIPYSFFLAILHLVDGQDYDRTVLLQIAVLAIIPILVYALTKLIGNRIAGLIAALLVIFREGNAIALTNIIQVSHSKLLMTDVPAMGWMALIIFCALFWFRRAPFSRYLPLLLGGMLGLFALLRGQALILLPFLIVSLFVLFYRQWRLVVEGTVLLALGFAAVVSPQVWRNYQMTGIFFINRSVPYSVALTGQFSFDNTKLLGRLPKESDEAYMDRINATIRKFILSEPGFVADFVMGHFVHNQIQTVMYLPLSFVPDDAKDYVKTLPFWGNWQGEFPHQSLVAFTFNILLLSLGLSAAWFYGNKTMLIPILLGFAYQASLSLVGYSGWRFLIPADWVTLIYYSLGLSTLVFMIQGLATGNNNIQVAPPEDDSARLAERPKFDYKRILVFMAALLILGSVMPVFEASVPKKFKDQDATRLLSKIKPQLDQIGNVDVFLNSPNAVVLYGNAYYPRFYKSGAGQHDTGPFQVRNENRLAFRLIGTEDVGVVFSMPLPPDEFPNVTEVLVLGCREQDIVESWVIYMVASSKIIRSDSINADAGLSCP